MKAAILKCKAGSRFHFGRYAPDSDTALNDSSEIMHSDTLFAALINTYNDLYDDTDDFVAYFERGDIRISSVFYCLEQRDNFVWFLPKPASFEIIETDDRKTFKRIRYISKKLWEHINAPEELMALMSETSKVAILQERFMMLRDEIELIAPENEEAWRRLTLYHSINLPKVQVRERKNEGNLYQLNIIEIGDNTERAIGLNVHYYFLYELSDAASDDAKQRFRQVLEVLVHSGIGAERSTIGQLEGIVADDPRWTNFNDHGDGYCTLSLLSPDESDLPALRYYRTVFRGGRAIGRNQTSGQMHLLSLQMIQEGAVVSHKVKGRVHSITPANTSGMPLPKFKRCGTALTLPLKKSWLS